MSTTFFEYIRNKSDEIPNGYHPNGMQVYRHLVWVGASQMIDNACPELRKQLGEENWKTLIQTFIRQSEWTSPYYGDLYEAFLRFIAQESA